MVGVCSLFAARSAGAQEAAPGAADTTELAKQTQNPVGDLISLPFQFNFNTGGDLGDGTFFNLNFQPVIPFRLSDDWTAIARTIIPIDSVPAPTVSRSAASVTYRSSSSSAPRSPAPSSGARSVAVAADRHRGARHRNHADNGVQSTADVARRPVLLQRRASGWCRRSDAALRGVAALSESQTVTDVAMATVT